MDLRSAFKDEKNRLDQLARVHLGHNYIFLEQLGLISGFTRGLNIVAKDHNDDISLTTYIKNIRSVLSNIFCIAESSPSFTNDQCRTLYKITSSIGLLDHFALDKDGHPARHLISKNNPVRQEFTQTEIDIYFDYKALQSDPALIGSEDISFESRILYYAYLIEYGAEYIHQHRRVSAISDDTASTLNCLLNTLDAVQDAGFIHPIARDMTIRHHAYHLLDLPKADPETVVFMTDWRNAHLVPKV